jgi:hypothetical protein
MDVQCPYCGEALDLDFEADVVGTLVQDCDVCCNPIQLMVRRDAEGEAQVSAERAD